MFVYTSYCNNNGDYNGDDEGDDDGDDDSDMLDEECGVEVQNFVVFVQLLFGFLVLFGDSVFVRLGFLGVAVRVHRLAIGVGNRIREVWCD